MAKYSIILPVHNGGEYIKICVKSILAQQYQDFNLIILENCSTDGTVEWLQAITDKRVMIIPFNRLLTIEESWARIRETPKNEFITLIGHDDILYPDFLQLIDEMMAIFPEASLYHTHFDLIDGGGKLIRHSRQMRPAYSASEFLEAFMTRSLDSMGTGYVMRAKDYDLAGGIPTRYPNLLFADFELWVKLAFGSTIRVAERNCFAFRVHQGTTGRSADRKLHIAFANFIEYLANLRANDQGIKNVIERCGGQFILTYAKSFAHRLLRRPLSDREGVSVKDFISQTKQLAEKIGVQEKYHPERVVGIKAALMIDGSKFLRSCFLLFKTIYSKPVIRN